MHGNGEPWRIVALKDGRAPVGISGREGVVQCGGRGGGGYEVYVEGPVARSRGWEVPICGVVGSHFGWIPVAYVDA